MKRLVLLLCFVITPAQAALVDDLILAVYKGDAESVDALIARGAPVNALGQGDESALMRAAGVGDTAMLGRLLSHGAGIDLPNSQGHTALMIAVNNKRTEAVEWLLDNGAAVNATSNWGTTVLMYAALAGNAAIVELLIARGTDPEASNKGGKTAADFATEGGYPELIALLQPPPAEAGPTPAEVVAKSGQQLQWETLEKPEAAPEVTLKPNPDEADLPTVVQSAPVPETETRETFSQAVAGNENLRTTINESLLDSVGTGPVPAAPLARRKNTTVSIDESLLDLIDTDAARRRDAEEAHIAEVRGQEEARLAEEQQQREAEEAERRREEDARIAAAAAEERRQEQERLKKQQIKQWGALLKQGAATFAASQADTREGQLKALAMAQEAAAEGLEAQGLSGEGSRSMADQLRQQAEDRRAEQERQEAERRQREAEVRQQDQEWARQRQEEYERQREQQERQAEERRREQEEQRQLALAEQQAERARQQAIQNAVRSANACVNLTTSDYGKGQFNWWFRNNCQQDVYIRIALRVAPTGATELLRYGVKCSEFNRVLPAYDELQMGPYNKFIKGQSKVSRRINGWRAYTFDGQEQETRTLARQKLDKAGSLCSG